LLFERCEEQGLSALLIMARPNFALRADAASWLLKEGVVAIRKAKQWHTGMDRVSVLTRHLVSATDPASLPDFDPKEVYLWLTRDNVELRERMLDHLKVRMVL